MTRFQYTSLLKTFCLSSFIATAVLSSCNSEEKKAAEKTAAPVADTTEVFAVQKGRLSASLQLPGELIANQQVEIFAKQNSFVKQLYADVGSAVSAGQLLVTMEAPELGSQVQGALSAVKSREAVYLASKASYDRLFETSKTPGTISPNDLEQAAARKSADLALLESAKAAYRQATEMQGYLQIRAPFSGVISARNVNLGAYVGPGASAPLFTLQEQKKLRLILSVPEAYSSYLSNKNEVSFSVKSLPDQQFTAQVKRLSGALDNRYHSQRIEMDVPNDNKKLLPGMVAEVNLPLPASDSAFIVPKSALVNSTESIFVVRVLSNKAERVTVKTGREANGSIEVYGNLTTGDLLLKTATDEIKNGSPVAHTKLVDALVK